MKVKIPKTGSLISQQCQAIELYILLAVYDLAEQGNARFTVVLHQHDGLTIAVHDKRDEVRVLKQVCKAVKARTDALGIQTELVLKIPVRKDQHDLKIELLS